jgi:hypothetical protein
MTVRELAVLALESRELPAPSHPSDPEVTAFDRIDSFGAVLLVLRRREPERALVGLYERTEEEWLEHTLYGSPWPGLPTAGLMNDLGLAASNIDGRQCFVYAGATASADVELEIEVDGRLRSVEVQPATSCFVATGLWKPRAKHTLHARATRGGRSEEHTLSLPP